MTNEGTPASSRKFVIQAVSVLFGLPILYALSSGPVLFLASHLCHRDHLKVQDVTYRSERRIQITRNGMAENTNNQMCGSACDFYRPLFRAATATFLRQPFLAYVRLWQVPIHKIKITGKTGVAQHPSSGASPTPVPSSQ